MLVDAGAGLYRLAYVSTGNWIDGKNELFL